MLPVLARFTLGDAAITIRAYSTFLVLAGVVALVLAVQAAARLGIPRGRAAAWFGVAIGAGLAGARLVDVALDWDAYAADPGRIIAVEARGFALYGGLGAMLLVVLAAARRWRVSAWALADAGVPTVTAGLVLLRIGCFLNGCCSGVVTDLPWAVRFPYGSSAWGQQVLDGRAGILGLAGAVEPVHPTQLYELGAVLVGAAVAMALRRRGGRTSLPAGIPALVFAGGFLAFRAANQVLRPPLPSASLPTALLVAVYAVVAVGCVLLVAWRIRPTARLAAGGALPGRHGLA